MDKYKFGEFIYNLRIANHLTQDELGRKIGVTNKAVSKWEVGETLPDVSLMPLLAKALGVTTDDLYAGEVIKIDPIKIVEKKKPIIWIILISILSLLLIGTSSYILFENIKKDNDVCYLNEDNYQNYLVPICSIGIVKKKKRRNRFGYAVLRYNYLVLKSFNYLSSFSVILFRTLQSKPFSEFIG